MFIYRFMVYILSNISIKDSVILKVEGSGSSGDSWSVLLKFLNNKFTLSITLSYSTRAPM